MCLQNGPAGGRQFRVPALAGSSLPSEMSRLQRRTRHIGVICDLTSPAYFFNQAFSPVIIETLLVRGFRFVSQRDQTSVNRHGRFSVSRAKVDGAEYGPELRIFGNRLDRPLSCFHCLSRLPELF